MSYHRFSLSILIWLRVAIFGILYASLIGLFRLTLNEIAPYWPIIFIVGNLLTLLIFDIILRHKNQSFFRFLLSIMQAKISKKEFLYTFLWMFGAGVGGMILISILFFQGPPPDLIYSVSWSWGLFYIIFFPTTAALSEIPFYYGFIDTSWKVNKSHSIIPLLYIILVYGIQHAFLPLLWDIKFILFRIISFIPLMILIGIYRRKNKSLKSVIIIHGLMDLSTVLQMLI
jgi:hypothetical protein